MTLRRTRGSLAADDGFGLIEVMVAMLVLAIVATGVVASMTTIIRMTADNRARITAANLATQDLDLVRAIGDPYQISNKTTYASPDGETTFRVERTVSWVSAAGADVSCNSGTNLFFLRVNERVTWDGQLATTGQVQDDTLLAPADASSSAETGAINISVEDANGDPVQGVSVVVTPTTGGRALASQPAATTVDGCTYANQVEPGTYSVTVTKSGYIDTSQATAPAASVNVTAGATSAAPFVYDRAATYRTNYVSGPLDYTARTVRVPTNLPTNFLHGSGTPYTTNAPASSKLLFPWTDGYSITAGFAGTSTVGCASIDPAAWLAGTSNGVALRDGVRAFGVAPSGGSTTVDIPMGVVLVRAANGAALHATQAAAVGQGNPGCSVTGSSLNWAVNGTGSWVALALPYGSWTVTANGSAVAAADLQVVTNVAPGGVSLDGTVTLDPRKAR